MREPQPIAQPPQVEKHPLKISEGVLQAQLISRIEPRYPTLAKQTKTEGIVRLHAIISRDVRITSLDILSGHPLLVQAALEAVSQWRYRPTMLNGEPVEVETSITVIFRLHD
jgi:protein TonB